MAKRQYEKPTQGNPLQLPIEQHVFPVQSIARFTDTSGAVQVRRFAAGQTFSAKPDNPVFCAMRAWDARAERGYMKMIEDEFQDLAGRVLSGKAAVLGPSEKGTVDRFFALWKWRAWYRDADPGEIKMNGVTGNQWTPEQEEKFEKHGVLFHREGGGVPAHRMYGMEIQVAIDRECMSLAEVKWNVARSFGKEFLVPDFPKLSIVPVSPTISIAGGDQYLGAIAGFSDSTVVGLNKTAQAACRSYCFAQALTRCF